MSQDALKSWYIAGLHAYRSAAEQAKEAAKEGGGKVGTPELKTLVAEMATLCGRQQDTMVAFLKQLDTAPNDFKDRIQEGIIKGTEMAVEAAEDDHARDVALHFGSRAGLTYFVTAFDNHASYARALGMAEQADTFEALSTESRTCEQRFAKLAETRLSQQAA